MPSRARRLGVIGTAVSLMLALLFDVAFVRAHGGAPAALGIVAADSNGVTLVSLNEGLARAEPDGWSFLCPRLWGDAETAAGKVSLALSGDGVKSWIIGHDDLYLAEASSITPQGRSDLDRNAVLALAPGPDASVLGLRFASQGSEVIEIGATGARSIWSSSDYWSSLAVFDDRIYLARLASSTEIGFATLSTGGELLDELKITMERAPQRVRLRPTSERLYAVLFDGMRETLVSVERTGISDVVVSEKLISGPQASPGGQLWLASSGQLMRAAADGFEVVDEKREITCLDTWGSQPYACAGGELYRLGDEGLGERLFQIDRLRGPDPALVPPAAAQECEFQWLLFKNDLERSGLSPREWSDATSAPASGSGGVDASAMAGAGAAGSRAPLAGAEAMPKPEPPAPRSSGCAAAAPGSPRGALLLACLGLAWLVYRRRRALPLRPLAWLCLLGGSAAAGQALGPAAPSDASHRALAVATYSGGEITVGELEDAIAVQSPLARSSALEPVELRKLLDRSVRFELLAAEAERRGYGESARVVQAIKEYAVQELVARERRASDGADPALTDAEIEAYRREHPEGVGTPELRRASLILVKGEAEARALLAQLSHADLQAFRAAVQAHSVDGASKPLAGDLGAFDVQGKPEEPGPTLDPKLVRASFALRSVGDVSDVIALDGGFGLLKLTELRPAEAITPAQADARIRALLAQKRRQAAIEALVADQRAALAPAVHAELLDQLPLTTDAPAR